METPAAFFETRRFAAMLGATVEFSKWEGQTYDPKRNVIYIAMSDVRRGMEDLRLENKVSTKFDMGTTNDVRVQYNRCGENLPVCVILQSL